MNIEHDQTPATSTAHSTWAVIDLKRRDGTTVAHTIVDRNAAPALNQWTWRLSSEGYAVRSETCFGIKRSLYLHRVIASTPVAWITDHINGDRLDNRRANLRTATPAQNNANSRRRRRDGSYRGVYWHRQAGRWMSQISLNGRVRHLGLFDDPQEAARAYDLAARAAHGAFARTNGLA